MTKCTTLIAAAGTALTVSMVVGANAGSIGTKQERRSAETCHALRARLDRLEKMIDVENKWLDPANPTSDDFGSQQEQRDIAAAKLTARKYIKTANVYLSNGCTDPGYIASFAHILDSILR